MDDPLSVIPFSLPINGTVNIPGSKSITNRAMILAAMGTGTVTLTGALFSQDTKVMIQSLGNLGFSITADEADRSIHIKGIGGEIPEAKAKIFVENAGTAARFLTAFLCTKEGGEYQLDGTPAMRKRPMAGLIDSLAKLGARFEFQEHEGFFPFTLKTNGIKSGSWKVDASASSQILSALMMIAPMADGAVSIQLTKDTVSKPFVTMTAKMMNQFCDNQQIIDPESSQTFEIASNKKYSIGGDYAIEPDATAASYFLTLPALVGGTITLPGVVEESLQGDIGYKDIIARTGVDCSFDQNGLISKRNRKQLEGGDYDFNPISDTFLTLAAIAPLLNSPTIIRGIAHTRKQETDRIAAMATELKKMGQGIIEKEDSLEIHPNATNLIQSANNGVTIDTYHDHRVAMSFGILGSTDILRNQNPWIHIKNPSCCEKTFPDFFEQLNGLRP